MCKRTYLYHYFTQDITLIYPTLGNSNHTDYIIEHQKVSEVREELDKTAAMEIKILAMEVEKKYWQSSILSLIKQLHSPTSGIYSHGIMHVHMQMFLLYVSIIPTGDPLMQYCKYALEQQQLNAQYIENAVSDLRT